MRKACLPVRETDIVSACLDYLVARRILCWRINSGAVHGTYKGKDRYVQFVRFPDERGLPDEMKKSMADIGAVLPGGTYVAIEVKRPGEKATIKQNNFLDEVTRFGGIGVVVTSADELARVIDRAIKDKFEVPDGR